ncbi:tetratricopeptide repeat protein [Helicobacter suis]|uniref:tetratricopeptide repeat protein n=1 Tax=Helicobacter suis TaxID=104628 RepID=UPI0013D568F0|nr:tetratricopeptide repeat protein [Helicobacter suis]
MLKNVLRVALVGVLCLGSIQAKEESDWYFSALKAYQNKNYQKALKRFKKAADAGSAKAYYFLGLMYENGWGVAKDDQQALEYYKEAVKGHENVEAYSRLGFMYANGKGVTKDYKKALEYLKKAASMGDAEAYAGLGEMYKRGEGVRKNLQKARAYYKKACRLGDKKACNIK